MTARFGSPDTDLMIRFLTTRGFTLTRQWEWIAPDRDIAEDEGEVIAFLVDEWDFGGVVAHTHTG